MRRAHSVQLYDCGDLDCHIVHLALCDEGGDQFATANMTIETMQSMLIEAQRLLYAKAAMR